METSESDFQLLFTTFHEVYQFCENSFYCKDPRIVFSSAKLLENTYLELERLNALEEFQLKLTQFWDLNALPNTPLIFFKTISSTLLCKFITDSKFNDNEVLIAIKEFLSFHSDDEFIDVVGNLTITHRCMENLIVSRDAINISEYQAELQLKEFSKQLIVNYGIVEQTQSMISNFVSQNKDNFTVSINILCLSSSSELALTVQNLISISINNFLRTPESIIFYTCILDISEEKFKAITRSWQSFIDTFIISICYSVKRLKCFYTNNVSTWDYSGSDQGLSFENIVTLINRLKPQPQQNQLLINTLIKLSEEGFGLVIEDLCRRCKINQL